MRRIAMICLLLASCGQLLGAAPDAYSRFTWQVDDPRFGGLSGIEVIDSGQKLIAISDRGLRVDAKIIRNSAGHISGVSDVTLSTLQPPSGQRAIDSEGLALGPNGETFVSTEGVHQVLRYQGVATAPEVLPQHKNFARMQSNSSLEALAIDRDGALYTMPERSGRATRPFPVYRFKDGAWDIALRIPRRGSYLVVGADIGPDNRLYVLERHFTGISFQSRLRRFALDGSGEETLFETSGGTHDNLEGVSIWQSPSGLRATLVSDDNFRFFQRSELVEYPIKD